MGKRFVLVALDLLALTGGADSPGPGCGAGSGCWWRLKSGADFPALVVALVAAVGGAQKVALTLVS